jgi:hypothetical protein
MSDKKLIYAVAGGAAFVGAAVLFYLYSNTSKAEVSIDQCMEEIEALGAKQMTPQGVLAFDYYKNVFAIISKYAKTKFGKEKRTYIEKRRVLLKAEKLDEYKEVVKELIAKEEHVFSDLLGEAMEHLGLSEQEFMQMHQMYMSNPQTQQALMQAQLAPSGNEKVTISKEKTKEIFLYSEERKMESMKKMMGKGV